MLLICFKNGAKIQKKTMFATLFFTIYVIMVALAAYFVTIFAKRTYTVYGFTEI